MVKLCEVLAGCLNPVIVAVAFLESVLLICSFCILFGFRLRIDRLNKSIITKKGFSQKSGKGKVKTTYESTSSKNWYEFDQFLKEYQEKGKYYSAFSMVIQIFPLLGILGTVAGLYVAMSENQNIYSGVEFALSSTVLGLIFAILFKVVDVVLVSWFINYIDDGISRYEKVYSVDNEDAQKGAVAAGTVGGDVQKESAEEGAIHAEAQT